MDLLELNVLGAFRINHSHINHSGQSLAHGITDKARALLTFLALEGVQPRSSLATLLWPNLPQNAAFDNLRKTLYRLRQKLDQKLADSDNLLITRQQSVQLNPERVVVDVVRFQTLLADTNRHAHATLASCEQCLTHLAEAVDLYQGELLAGFALGDSPAFEEWLLLRRETLHYQALLAFGALTTAWEERGELTRAQQYGSRTLALDPFREEAQRQQMRLLARLGQRNQALQQYQNCLRLLQDELGVEPEPATVALYEQIRRGDLHSDILHLPPSPRVEPQAKPTTSHQLPQEPSKELPKEPAKKEGRNSLTWGEVPEMGRVHGRTTELAQLQRWLIDERCQMVTIIGIGGMGKSTLAATIANSVAATFDKVIWRSLLNAPPLNELLPSILLSLVQQPLAGLPSSLDEQLALLLNEFRQQRCLLVLDNLESILQPEGIGQMQVGYEGYMQLLRQMAESKHTSSLLLTSRERPQIMARWEADFPWVQSLRLEGIDNTAGQAILAARGLDRQGVDGQGLDGQSADSATLVERYSGHPLALKLVAETIQDLFGGDIAAFLASEVVIFDDIQAILDQQFNRLPALEQELLFWLAVEREPISLEKLCANLTPARSMQESMQALRALQRRSLVQSTSNSRPLNPIVASTEFGRDTKFTSPNVIMEYLVARLVEIASREIEQEQPIMLHKYAFMQAQAMEYLRVSQMRLILQPLASRLEALWGHDGVGRKITHILHQLHDQAHPIRGYAVGNLLNLLTLMEIDVGALDLAGLSIWQADLRQAKLAGSNLSGADLTGSRFMDAFNMIRTVAVSPDGTLIAAGTNSGEIRLWNANNGQLLQVYRGHKDPVRSISFHPTGQMFASGSEDRTVRLWRVDGIHTSDSSTSEVEPYVRILEGHTGRVTSTVFHPNGNTLVSGSVDGTIRIWDVASGKTESVIHEHQNWLWAVAISPDGRTLASSGYDQIIRLWDIQTTQLISTFTGHKALVSSLAFDPTGTRLASGSYDFTVCIWNLADGQKTHSFEASTDLITSVAFSPDGKLLATGGDDWMMRLWNTQSGDLVSVFHGHRDIITSIAFSPNGQTLISAGVDQQLCLWDIQTSRIDRIFSGYSQTINSLAFHPNGKLLASGHYDHIVRLWQLDTQAMRQPLYGHTLSVNSVAFSADGSLLASGSDDKSIQVWKISPQGDAGQSTVLRGHQRDVLAIDFHPDGKTLLSGSEDQTIGFWNLANAELRDIWLADDEPAATIKLDPSGKLLASATHTSIRLWNVETGLLYTTLKSHTPFIWSLAFSPDGHWLASSGSDGSIALWDVRDPTQATHKRTLHGHVDRVFTLAFHPNGKFIASGSADHTVRVWNIETQQVVHILTGHTQWIYALAFSPDGNTIASGGWDETIRLWDSERGESLAVLHTPGPYAGMNIRQATGISNAERATLKLLGAIEQ